MFSSSINILFYNSLNLNIYLFSSIVSPNYLYNLFKIYLEIFSLCVFLFTIYPQFIIKFNSLFKFCFVLF